MTDHEYAVINSSDRKILRRRIFGVKKVLGIMLCASLCMSLFLFSPNITLVMAANVSGGSGTTADPYVITTAAQLGAIPTTGSSLCYKLGCNIDCSSYTTWTPIGTFTGTFDGAKHEITGLTAPLISCISGATVSNLGVVANITSSSAVGAIAEGMTSSSILCCYSTGTVISTTSIAGGLIGQIYGTASISQCYSTVAVTGYRCVGGLIGDISSNGVNVTNCYARGNITATGSGEVDLGGLIGSCDKNTQVTNCYTTGDLHLISGNCIGGICGYSGEYYNVFTNCYSAGNLFSTSCFAAGGVIGQTISTTTNYCYWAGNFGQGVGDSNQGYTDVNFKSITLSNLKIGYFAERLNTTSNMIWKWYSTLNDEFPVLDGVGIGNVDTTPPTGSYSLSKTSWTCNSVIITVNATDSSGVASITMPGGTILSGSTATYTVATNGTYSFILTDTAGNSCTYPVTVTNIDRTVTVTHPLTVSYTIDPNAGTFTGGVIAITNNSQHIGVAVSVQSLTSTGISDVSPSSYSNWNALTAAQTSSGMALGIGIQSGDAWATINTASPIYAANIASPTQFGVLDIGGTGDLALCAKYGLAWSDGKTVTHNLTLIFTACDV